MDGGMEVGGALQSALNPSVGAPTPPQAQPQSRPSVVPNDALRALQANDAQTQRILEMFLSEFAVDRLAMHMHDTRGTALANVLWNQPALQVSTKIRTSLGMWIGEVLATAGLLAIILVLKRRKQDHLIIVAVPAWITSAIFFTPSTSFANPAVTIGRMFSDTFAGIAPESAWLFISAQLVGALIVFVFFRITEHDSTKERVSK
jgi:hypothetical protein